MFDNSIKHCAFCGEITNGKFCPNCKTKEGRREAVEEQLKIDKENEKKGYNLAPIIFGQLRENVIKKCND